MLLFPHGGGRRRCNLESLDALVESPSEDLLALNEALTRLTERDRRKGDVVMLRFFAGLTIEETAQALGVSPATVKTEWSFAKAWLYHEVVGDDSGSP
ncbi:MAG: hypothetical protein IIA67_06265 [Planctomycetes bacterium]|nr:hypothetical protein [Planctomycetota bacterium]